jgi:hypothetical protein
VVWLNGIAWIGAAAIVAPIVIHLLVHRRAEAIAFPTLRFVQPTRLAAIRRRTLDDLVLLLVRCAALAAAAGALAGPLLVTDARQRVWNARIVRAIVTDAPAPYAQAAEPVFREQTFAGPDLRDGAARATRWLAAAPPARRELVIVSPLVVGSIDRTDLTDVPAEIGVRFVRSGTVPERRSLVARPVWTRGAGASSRSAPSAPLGDGRATGLVIEQRERIVELDGPRTSVRDTAAQPIASLPIDIVAPPDVRSVVDAALAAVLTERVLAPVAGRRARVIIAPAGTAEAALYESGAPLASWIADAIARITADADLQRTDPDGRPLVAATTDGTTLIVTSTAPAIDTITPLAFRAVLNALAASQPVESRSAPAFAEGYGGKALAERETLAIPDADLRSWERPAADFRWQTSGLSAIDEDDRRWWWAGVVVLLALEAWLRRSRSVRAAAEDREDAPVA